ncbi:hypothetical protein [Providencia stuartii]|uniref:hypothetical protein n=1 Tax=Providencia stuartii TaxID=588 RepID=UPI0023B10E16|nr:hypothetical protein [Providencia thailandensis]MDE8748563.1 hypothetical protein [Providencia thailandensis]MDE8767868.1 hypothetical protein [Providencia thailandensis]MDE8780364.1 hypothetical protein [Providencia thailandensis]MDE8784362.1 hypothetical protein [Providencia thailandensis]MDE8788356.1 hypothetical protein [Providencia thailandensis]
MKSIIWKGFSWVMENMTAVGMVIFVGMFLVESIKNTSLEHENKLLTSQLSTSQLLNQVTQSAITLHYQASLDNIKAKQLEDSEHVKVKTVIKTVLKDNECANTAVPDDVVSELRKYKRDIDSRSASADTSAINR